MLQSTRWLACEDPRRIRTVRDDHGVLSLDRFVRDGCGEIDGEEDRVHLSSDGVEGSFEEDCDV